MNYRKFLFSRHLRLNHHDFKVENGFKRVFKPLHLCDKGNLLDLLEILEINKANSNDKLEDLCLNDQLRLKTVVLGPLQQFFHYIH